MKDINYDLIKLLLCKMNSAWRLEKHYCDDAKKAQCQSHPVLQKMLEDEKRHIEQLRKEIEARVKAGVFD